jgi:ribosomal protein S18 acetylase RimI-like enzyme
MSASIKLTTDQPSAEQLLALFDTTGWNEMYQMSSQALASSFENSWYKLCAYDGDQLVGMGRMVSDGFLYAVMFDIIVAPEYKRTGVGTQIVNRLLEHCVKKGIRDVLLFSAKGTEAFYERFGFVRRPEHAPGMILRRAQSG